MNLGLERQNITTLTSLKDRLHITNYEWLFIQTKDVDKYQFGFFYFYNIEQYSFIFIFIISFVCYLVGSKVYKNKLQTFITQFELEKRLVTLVSNPVITSCQDSVGTNLEYSYGHV